MRIASALGLLLALTACQTTPPETASAPNIEAQGRASAVQSECAIYYAVNAARVDEGLPVIAGLTQGCPAGTDSIAANIAPRPNAGLTTSLADTVRRRMIARGMPVATANAVSTSSAFEALVVEIAAL